jgi:inosine-uridine nucleoside N-ribohydrolase
MRRASVGIALAMLNLTAAAAGQERRVPLLIDTDLGSYLDDAFALALTVASPAVELRGVTTSGGDAETRACMACRFLHAVGRDTPVAWGRPPQAEGKVEALYQYRYHPALLYGRMGKPVAEDAAELMHRELKARPGEITLLVLGPLTNVARLLENHPDSKGMIKQIVAMGGALDVGLDGGPVQPEWNIKSDIPAARAVLDSGVRLRLVPLDVTWKARLTRERCQALFATQTPLTQQLQLLDQLADEETPALHDAVAATAVLDLHLFAWTGLHVTIDDSGLTRMARGKTNAEVAASVLQDELLKRLVERIAAHGKRTEQRTPLNIAEPVERGGLPRRVHVFEDYQTDIERRWWLAGKTEPAQQKPPPSGLQSANRICRGILTQDFDDKQGDHGTLYTAVIFNPVPGPPMGQRTRLAFRYRLDGGDALRVQLYSLSNGYHRHLTLRGLPQGEWRKAAVDMTKMRRPDGSGGPLAKDERIDDIQFYAAPTANLRIDDVVLYDAAPDDEQQPFPKRLVFTGWFDTGKQGQEWPGDFEIVSHQPPRTWKAAGSIENMASGRPWIRVSLRGQRPVGKTTNLRFAYQISGAKPLQLVLANSHTGKRVESTLDDLTPDAWLERTVELDTSELAAADELQFLLPAGATLLIDDVLLYEP